MDINADIANVQTLENATKDCIPSPVTRRRLNDEAGDCPSPNTRRRLLKLKAPKLHIKIPFLKRQNYDERGCQSAEVVSQSLPTESYMPKYFDHVDVELCQECEEDSEYISSDHPDSSNQISKPEKQEDEADSDKHQSDLDENEKENDADNEAESKTKDDSNKNEEGGKTSDSEEVKTPASQECKLKPCLKVTYHGRRRASTYPGPHDCLEASFKRCVTFSPDTIEPATRDCKYREWIEKKCLSPKSPPVNVKHEKRKCQLNQMRKVNISDYMSKNYGSSFFSPIGTYGGDMLL